MSFAKPTGMEKIAQGWFSWNFLGKLYRNYINTLQIREAAKVLDFGSGAGMSSRYIIKKLHKSKGELTCLEPSEFWMNYSTKKLRRHKNIYFTRDHITENNLAENYFNIVYIHLVLHDIHSHERPDIIKALAKVMKEGGVLYIREPMSEKHGMPAEEIDTLMNEAGLNKISGTDEKVPLLGMAYRGVYTKKNLSK